MEKPRMPFFRLASVLAAVLLLASLAACSATASPQATTATSTQSPTTAAAATSSPTAPPAPTTEAKKDVTLTVMMYGINQMSGVQDDKVSQEIKKQTGITIDIVSTASQDVATMLTALIASDDLPDIISAPWPQHRSLLMDAGMIIPLDDLLVSNGQDVTNKKAGQYAVNYAKKYYSSDSKLYFVPLRAGVDFTAGLPTTAPYIRWDLYKGIGEPAIKNMDDLLTVLKQMQDKYPTTPDGKKAYAISGCIGDPSWNIFSLSACESFTGDRKIDEALTGNVNISNLSQYQPLCIDKNSPLWQQFKFFNKAFQMGILDPDTATMKYDQWAEKITAGQVYYVPFGWFSGTLNDPDKLFLPVKFDTFQNDAFTCSYAYSQGQVPYAISKKCKNPDRAMDLLNFAWSYDGAYLIMNGLKGQEWDIADGKPQLTDSYVQTLKAGGQNVCLYSAFTGPFLDERTNTPINLANTTEYFQKYTNTGLMKEYDAKYNISSPIENYTTAKYHVWDEAWQYGLKAYEGDMKVISDNVKNYVLLNLPKVLLAKDDAEFASMQDKFIKDVLGMGAQKLYDFSKADYEQYIQGVLALSK